MCRIRPAFKRTASKDFGYPAHDLANVVRTRTGHRLGSPVTLAFVADPRVIVDALERVLAGYMYESRYTSII